MSSRSSDLLKGKSPEPNDSGSDAQAQPLSLTSVSEKPKTIEPAKTVDVAAAKPEVVAPKPAAKPATPSESLFASSDSLLMASTSTGAPTVQSRLAGLTSTSNINDTKQALQAKQNADLGTRFAEGAWNNLKGQAAGLVEIGWGKSDQLDELNSTLTGKKTGNEHVAINVVKTTLSVTGVVKDLAADTVGLGDGKTTAALGKAIDKAKTDFVNGSWGDRFETMGSATAFGATLFLGGAGTVKGGQGLATDARALRTLIQTEKQTATLSEAVTGMKALKATEQAVVVADRLAVSGGDDLVRVVAQTARTTPVAPSRLSTAWMYVKEEARSLANTFVAPGGMEPALAGAGGGTFRMGSRSTAILAETPAAKSTSFLRGLGGTADETTGLLGRRVATTPAAPLAKVGVAETAVPTTVRRVETAATSLTDEAAKGKALLPRTEVPIARVPRTAELPPGIADDLTHRPGIKPAVETPGATRAGEVKVVPNTAEVKVVPNTAEVKVAPNAAEVKVAPNAAEVKVVPNAAEVKVVPNAGEVKVVPNAGEVKVVKTPGVTHVDDAKGATTGIVDDARTVKTPVTPEAPAARPLTPEAPPAKPITPEAPTAKTITPETPAARPLTPEAPPAKPITPEAPTAKLQPAEVAPAERPLPQVRPTEVRPTNVVTETTGTFDDVARVAKPGARNAETAAAEANVVKSAGTVEQRIARITENMTGPEANVVKENLATLQNNTRQLVNSADNATQINANIDQALRNLELAVGKNPMADDIAKLARETRELQTSVSASRNFAVIERNSQVLVQSGDDIGREIGKLAPKAGKAAEADVQEITRLSKNLGQGGDDIAIVRQINERVANISKNSGTEVADEIARTLKPSLQKAEATAVESTTLRGVTKVEQRVARMTETMTGPEAALARQDVATVQRNVQKLLSGADDAAATRSIDRALADLQSTTGKSKYADEITKLTQETREVQHTVSVSRNLAAVENNAKVLATGGKTLSDDAARLAADPLKAAAKADLDEIARLGKNLGQGGDDIAAVTKINERLANISRNVGTEAADDIARTLKPTIQKVEATAIENGAIKTATKLEQSIARTAETVGGPEAAAIRNNLETLQRATRGFVNNADNAAAHSEDINRALQNLERIGAKTGAADDIARISQETRELQQSLNASRRLTTIEGTTKTIAAEGRGISDEVTRIGATPQAKAVQQDLDEISRLSKNLGKTGDDLDTVRKINERIANIGRNGGTELADDVARTVTPKVQKVEAAAIDANRMKTAQQLTTTVETEAKALTKVTDDIVRTLDTSTTQGRVLQQQLKAIQRTAEDLPTAANPATEATRLRTMVTAVEKSLPAAERAAIKATVNNLDNAATELTVVRTMGQQTRLIDEAATTLRGTVTRFQDDVTRGAQVIKPGTEDAVRRALTTVESNTASINAKLGTTQRIDSEVRALRNAAATLDEAGQPQLARQINQEVKAIEKAETIRGLEITSHQGPILSNIAHNQTLATRTIEQVERDLASLRTWGNIRGTGKLDTISDLHENLQMLRHIAKNDANLLAYVDDAQQALAKIEMQALSTGGRALEAKTPQLLAMAEAGNTQALNKLFIKGLQSDSWTLRSLMNSAMTEPGALIGRIGDAGARNAAAFGRLFTRPEAYALGARTALDLAMFTGGASILYGNFKYHSQALLKAIEDQMQTAPSTSPDAVRKGMENNDAKEANEAQRQSAPAQEAARERRADLDFSPSVGAITRRMNFTEADNSMAARYGFSADDPEALIKADSIFNTSKLRRWQAQGYAPAVEQAVTPNIPVARTIRIKGPDGTSIDPNAHQKTAVTNFSFTRAMALTNQLKLMTSNGDNRGGAAGRSSTVFGGGPSSSSTPSLSQNLRTMVAFSALRTDSGSHAAVAHRESTEDTGIDQGGQGGGTGLPTIKGPQVTALGSASTNDPAPMTIAASVPSSTSATSADANDALRKEALRQEEAV
jgi:hypothetical protein